jgi:hypothetical protein
MGTSSNRGVGGHQPKRWTPYGHRWWSAIAATIPCRGGGWVRGEFGNEPKRDSEHTFDGSVAAASVGVNLSGKRVGGRRDAAGGWAWKGVRCENGQDVWWRGDIRQKRGAGLAAPRMGVRRPGAPGLGDKEFQTRPSSWRFLHTSAAAWPGRVGLRCPSRKEMRCRTAGFDSRP